MSNQFSHLGKALGKDEQKKVTGGLVDPTGYVCLCKSSSGAIIDSIPIEVDFPCPADECVDAAWFQCQGEGGVEMDCVSPW